jgi:membrane protease YdiL (CAAX protease family)
VSIDRLHRGKAGKKAVPLLSRRQKRLLSMEQESVTDERQSGSLWSGLASPELHHVGAICLTACLSLWTVQFIGTRPQYLKETLALLLGATTTYTELVAKAWWVGWMFVSFIALPLALMALLPGIDWKDCHLSFKGFREHIWTYAAVYAAVLPVLWLASRTQSFSTYYPMYSQASRSWFDLLIWEGLYLAQFVAVEFFFRGFLLGGLAKQIGILSVPVCTVPYMLVHFQKLPMEAAGSVFGGLILGFLAWKTKSIWGGVCVHFGVALTMDLLGLAHQWRLP